MGSLSTKIGSRTIFSLDFEPDLSLLILIEPDLCLLSLIEPDLEPLFLLLFSFLRPLDLDIDLDLDLDLDLDFERPLLSRLSTWESV